MVVLFIVTDIFILLSNENILYKSKNQGLKLYILFILTLEIKILTDMFSL